MEKPLIFFKNFIINHISGVRVPPRVPVPSLCLILQMKSKHFTNRCHDLKDKIQKLCIIIPLGECIFEPPREKWRVNAVIINMSGFFVFSNQDRPHWVGAIISDVWKINNLFWYFKPSIVLLSVSIFVNEFPQSSNGYLSINQYHVLGFETSKEISDRISTNWQQHYKVVST